MNIKINNEPAIVAEGTKLASIAMMLQLPDKGVAVAVNNAMVPRAEWAARTVQEGDDIVILKAFCGG